MDLDVLTLAVHEMNALHGVDCKIKQLEFVHRGIEVDAQIQLAIGQEEILLNAEGKSKLVPAQVPQIVARKADLGTALIVIAHYITPRAKEMLVKEQIAYADTAGNIFLRKEAVYIYIENKKPNLDKIERSGRAFTPAGLKVVYQFLLHREYINKPYRFIGERAGVTIRTVGKTIEGLVNEKYVLKENKKTYMYADREKLLQSWVTAFNKTLKPKMYTRRYRWKDQKVAWLNLKLPRNTLWGGPAAAELLTNYLIADKWVIYTELDFMEVMKNLQLLPDKNGEVEVVKSFWNEPKDIINNENEGIVHPILVYADLIEDPSFRYVETAKLIYDEYVKNNL